MCGAPSFKLGQFLAAHVWIHALATFAYACLPCAVMVVFSAYLWHRPELETRALLVTFLLNLFLAVPMYLVVPVCGPAYAFAGFPYTLPHFTVATPILLHAPPNGIPSVHTSTALLIVWFARRWPAGMALGMAYLTLIVVATLGLGEHYVVDLLCAVPYAAIIARLGATTRPRRATNAPTTATAEPAAL